MPLRPGVPDGRVAAVINLARQEVAKRLWQARRDTGRSRADVAAAFNRTSQWLEKIEKAITAPDADFLIALCQELNVKPCAIVAGFGPGEDCDCPSCSMFIATEDENDTPCGAA